MSREAFTEWAPTHPLGKQITVTVDGLALEGSISEFAEYHGRIEVRIRLKRP